MAETYQFENARQREIYEYVEQNGVVWPEAVRQNVLVKPESGAKPSRSGPKLEPSVKMSKSEFSRHVDALERDGYLELQNGKLRVVTSVEPEATTVDIDTGQDAVVRAAREEDIDGIVETIEAVASDGRYVVAARLAETVDSEGVLIRHNESENRIFFVATVDDEPVGWLHLDGAQFDATAHTAELTVGIRRGYRGEGLGSALMDRGLDWAEEQGYRKVYQNLPATNEDAIEFLQSQGWEVESTREGHYLLADELVDEVQLADWLD